MTYLVTGCAGFIGSHVAAHLLDRGDEVVGVDNLNDAYDPVLKDWRLEQLQGMLAGSKPLGLTCWRSPLRSLRSVLP